MYEIEETAKIYLKGKIRNLQWTAYSSFRSYETGTEPSQNGGARGVHGGARGVYRGARGVIVIVVGNEHGDTSSNPGRDW